MFKRWRKKLLKNPLIVRAFCVLVAWYIRLVYNTSRKQMNIAPGAEPYADGQKNAVIVFWHGRLLMMPSVRPKQRGVYAMTSHHADGEMIARTMENFGIGIVRGSSSKGGASAIVKAVALLKEGNNIIITPDGPRGPAREMQPGAARIAAMAGVPVIPVSYSASRGKHVHSWDRFFIPYPFGRLVFMVGAPVVVEDDNEESASDMLRESLFALDAACDSATAR